MSSPTSSPSSRRGASNLSATPESSVKRPALVCAASVPPYGRSVAGTPRIAQLSLHQRDADLGTRERFLDELQGRSAADLFILATCHRIEITWVIDAHDDPRPAFTERLRVAIPDSATVRTGQDAVLHLIRAACGLDSVVRGEAQVLGQLRRAYDARRAAGGLDPALGLILRRTLETGRALRRSTALGTVRRTLGSLAVDAALAGLPDPRSATVLVIGAGEMGKLAIRALARRVGTVVVANRDADRGAELARRYGALAVPLESLDQPLASAAVVIAAADTRGAILTTDRLSARLAAGPLTVVDLAVPRSTAARARGLDGLRYIDVDGLTDLAGAELGADALARIEARCAAAADALIGELEQRRASPAIQALRERTEAIRKRQLERALTRLANLSDRDRRVVEAFSEALAHELMHEPTVRLRAEPGREPAARDLFAL